jgi:hypothetical protein
MEVIGYKTCPRWLKMKYRIAVNFTCQECKKPESEVGILEPHRIKRNWQGGLYTIYPLNHPNNNVKILCKKCHSLHHANEFQRVKSK